MLSTVHLVPELRYSEDIDLELVGDRGESSQPGVPEARIGSYDHGVVARDPGQGVSRRSTTKREGWSG